MSHDFDKKSENQMAIYVPLTSRGVNAQYGTDSIRRREMPSSFLLFVCTLIHLFAKIFSHPGQGSLR